MAVKVLVVDDSSFFRRRVSDIINQDPQLEVIGVATNGKEGIEQVKKLRPDVVTMDIEMPIMDGISSVREIMKVSPTPILMFSSLTHEGAKATFDALEAGALDFLPKKFEDIAKDKKEATALLQQRVKDLARKKLGMTRGGSAARAYTQAQREAPKPIPKPVSSVYKPSFGGVPTPTPAPRPAPAPSSSVSPRSSKAVTTASGKHYQLLAIGTSTGGPVALQTILTQFPQQFQYPILLIQHMPEAFTPAFANRLNSLCKIRVKEAEDGELLRPGTAYLAPGGKQMLVEGSARQAKLRIKDENNPRITYKPSVDLTFGSVAKIYGGDSLAVVLTGMGADGREGARLIKSRGGKVWAQDEHSCVVYGMPQAVASAGISELSLSLDDVAPSILKEMKVSE